MLEWPVKDKPPSLEAMQQLLDKAQAGSQAALHNLLACCYNLLETWPKEGIRHLIRGLANSSDLIQQTCLQALAHFADFKGQTIEQFLAWLHRILKNIAKDWKRKKDREPVPMPAASGSSSFVREDPEDPLPTPKTRALLREEGKKVHEALARLPAKYQQVLQLRFVNGLSYQEIAQHLGMTAAALDGRLRHGLTALKKELGPYGDSP